MHRFHQAAGTATAAQQQALQNRVSANADVSATRPRDGASISRAAGLQHTFGRAHRTVQLRDNMMVRASSLGLSSAAHVSAGSPLRRWPPHFTPAVLFCEQNAACRAMREYGSWVRWPACLRRWCCGRYLRLAPRCCWMGRGQWPACMQQQQAAHCHLCRWSRCCHRIGGAWRSRQRRPRRAAMRVQGQRQQMMS